MNDRPDGGNAFPYTWDHSYHPDTSTEEGMSLRDYFAAKALAGMADFHNGRAFDPRGTAAAAYELADEMLSARSGPVSPDLVAAAYLEAAKTCEAVTGCCQSCAGAPRLILGRTKADAVNALERIKTEAAIDAADRTQVALRDQLEREKAKAVSEALEGVAQRLRFMLPDDASDFKKGMRVAFEDFLTVIEDEKGGAA